jgi:hypothetical protein
MTDQSRTGFVFTAIWNYAHSLVATDTARQGDSVALVQRLVEFFHTETIRFEKEVTRLDNHCIKWTVLGIREDAWPLNPTLDRYPTLFHHFKGLLAE